MLSILTNVRVLFGGLIIAGAAAALMTGATGAFFNDTETSTDNLFTAGAFDLTVDNDSYYNGNRCVNVSTDPQNPDWKWQGSNPYPAAGTDCSTSFPASDLDSGLLFFNFLDLKPDDEGEDTISLHIQNEAYACMELSVTSNDDESSTEPELDTPDVLEDVNNTWDGELAQNIQFFWWADDGDNVFEDNENPLTPNDLPIPLLTLAPQGQPWKVALADAQNNVWGNQGPMPANQTVYIGKAWCLGTLTLAPVGAGQGVNPSVDSGVLCNGAALNNLTQTDSVTLDLVFTAVQARNNGRFLCDETSRLSEITVTKVVVNNNGGNNVIGDFQLVVDNGVTSVPVTSGVPTVVAPGSYTVTETGVSGYVASFLSGTDDCDANGVLSILAGESKSCELTNDDLPANITLFKNVVGGITSPTLFGLRIDGNLVQHNSSVAVTSNAAHSINEDGRAGYIFTSITGAPECPAVLGGTATLDEGQSITCTITNTATP